MHDSYFWIYSFRDVDLSSLEHLALLRSGENGFERVAEVEFFLLVFEEIRRFVCQRNTSVT